MIERLFGSDPALLIPIIMAICGTLFGIIAFVANQWRKVRQAEVEGALKQDMLQRGLSVDEIERVIQTSNIETCHDKKRNGVSQNEVELVKNLVDEGKSVEEIERIIRAVKGRKSCNRIESHV
jgi:hypothetical protein